MSIISSSNNHEEEQDTQQTSFLWQRRTAHSFIGRISNTRTVWSRDTLVSKFPCRAHARACVPFLCRWPEDIASMCLLYVTRQNMRYIQHHEPGSRAGPENLRRLSLPSETSRLIVGCHSKHLMSDTRPGRTCSSLGESPDTHSRVVSGCGQACIARREAETTHGFLTCGGFCEVVHVFNDCIFVRGCDVGAGVVGGQPADSSIVRSYDGFKVERQPVPSRELPTRGTGKYAASLWHPLGSDIRWEKNPRRHISENDEL